MIDPIRPVTDAELETYDRDGVVVLRDICPLDWVDEFRDTLDEVFNRSTDVGREGLDTGASRAGSRSDIADRVRGLLKRHDASSLAVEPDRIPEGRNIVETDACGWHAGIRNLHVTGPLPAVVAALSRSNRVNLYSDQLFLKEPGAARLALGASQDVLDDLGAVSELQKVAGVGQHVDRCVHSLSPRATPLLVEAVVLSAPDEVRGLVPVEQHPVVQGLRGAVAAVVVADGDGEREPAGAVESLVRKAAEGRGESRVPQGSFAFEVWFDAGFDRRNHIA